MDDWCPLAERYPLLMKTQGKYTGGYPKGAVIHFTGGRFENGKLDAINSIKEGIKNNYTYLCIARTGEIIQAHPVTEWGYHCGESSWNKVQRELQLWGTCNDDLIGIEMCNAGQLQVKNGGRFYTWYGEEIPKSETRYVYEPEYGCPTGFYHKYSPRQEESLAKLLMWLKANDTTDLFSFDHVLGHCEISGKLELGYWRKSDPGGSLSMPLKHFRQYLKDREKYFSTGLA